MLCCLGWYFFFAAWKNRPKPKLRQQQQNVVKQQQQQQQNVFKPQQQQQPNVFKPQQQQQPNVVKQQQQPNVVVVVKACIMYKLWKEDEFGMTHHHLEHWVHYMRHNAGVQHVTGYCNLKDKNECSAHESFFDVLKHWPEENYPTAQRTANTDCIQAAASARQWLIICDVDEYPFMPGDTAPGFLPRFLKGKEKEASQFLLRTLFFGERGKKVAPNETLYDTYTYRMPTAEDSGGRTKALFRPDLLDPSYYQPNIVHAMVMREGERTEVPDPINTLRLNHYWGPRLDRHTIGDLQYDPSLSLALAAVQAMDPKNGGSLPPSMSRHQRRVLQHMQERRQWEGGGQCVPEIRRLQRPPGSCDWSAPLVCTCQGLTVQSSMENNLQCVHGDENFACMSVDSGADVHMQYFDWNGIDFFSVPTEQQRDMGLLASFVSNCVGWRVNFLSALSLLLPAAPHHYGACLHNAEAPNGSRDSVKNWLAQRHRYVFSFENSERPGYVTEKLFYMLSAGAVPVYRGAPDVRRYLPSRDAAVIVSPDDTPQSIAQLLLSETNETYAKRLEWRQRGADLAWVARMDLGIWHSQHRLCLRMASMELPLQSGVWIRERGFLQFHRLDITAAGQSFESVCLAIVALLDAALSAEERSKKPRGGVAVVELYHVWDLNRCPITTLDELLQSSEVEAVLENPGWTRRGTLPVKVRDL